MVSVSQDLTWNEAIKRVLEIEGGAMHYVAIAERIKALGLRREMGANPTGTVAATLAHPDYRSSYQRVGSGEYVLRSALEKHQAPPINSLPEGLEAEAETGAIRALGMYWHRDQINWGPARPKLLGRQSAGDSPIDFASEIGVYLLHDRERVIYVGRATDAIGDRLKAHTIDRLRSRWDRFSWFGLYDVSEAGEVIANTVSWSPDVVIESLEAILIESLEPPLNRRRGDNFSAVEYLQAVDPEIERLKNEEFLARIAGIIRAGS
jgi:hypothetical protein